MSLVRVCMLELYVVLGMANTRRCFSARLVGCFGSSLDGDSGAACGCGRCAGDCEMKDGAAVCCSVLQCVDSDG